MKLVDYIAYLVAAKQQLQIMHWQTRSFANHKALGKAVDDLAENIDKYVEVACGSAGIHPAELALSRAIGESCSKLSPAPSANKEAKQVTALRVGVSAGKGVSSAGAYIVDEMVGALARAEYLLAIEDGWKPATKKKK